MPATDFATSAENVGQAGTSKAFGQGRPVCTQVSISGRDRRRQRLSSCGGHRRIVRCGPNCRYGVAHRALSGGRPDNAVQQDIDAVFFSDFSGGMDGAGIARLADLDRKGAVAGAISADSAPIGNSRALYHDGMLSHVNDPTSLRGGRVGVELKDFIEILIEGAKR
jgi:hypothetical protein